MKSAIDSNVLFDLLISDAAGSAATERVLAGATEDGPVMISPAVYAELAAAFEEPSALERFLRELAIGLDPFSPQALWEAARAWKRYTRGRGSQARCPRCGRATDLACAACGSPIVWRQHLITDFLIGGHAAVQADQLITRDPGYYRAYFPQLRLLVPAEGGQPPSL